MDELWTWWWVLWRASACLTVAPIIAGVRMPARIRLMAVIVLAWAMLPIAKAGGIPLMTLGWTEISLLTLRETLVGLVLGFASRSIVFAAQMAGQLISSEMGLQTAQILSPGTGESSNESGVILEFIAVLIVFGLQLHQAWLMAFAESYRVLPMSSTASISGDEVLGFFLRSTSETLALAMRLAMPVIAGGFILNVTLLLLGRALPQLPVFQDSFMFRAVVGLFLFGASLHLFAAHLNARATAMPGDLLTAARALRAGTP
jgi:flagellar biosynthetic protein FliR